ncbi:hypothetical protein [Teichococcus aestuarii]|uniref:hypothetical protein n=1 Tax=Teichococcus aestuarii TaxID=568898 RepID=UPI00361B8DB8
MATFSLIVLMGLLSGVGLLLFMAERERHRAQRRVIEMEQEVAQRTRHLDLFAQELHTLGLSLMGQSPQLAQGGAEGHARALLCTAADVHDRPPAPPLLAGCGRSASPWRRCCAR